MMMMMKGSSHHRSFEKWVPTTPASGAIRRRLVRPLWVIVMTCSCVRPTDRPLGQFSIFNDHLSLSRRCRNWNGPLGASRPLTINRSLLGAFHVHCSWWVEKQTERITVSHQNKTSSTLVHVSAPNIHRFSKFFYGHILQEMCIFKAIIEYPNIH